jgi:tRNA1Val (adenine37-N6)-methyltransferase
MLSYHGNMQVIMPYTEGSLFIAQASDYGFYCTSLIKIKAVPAGEIKRLIMRFERNKKPVSERFITIGTGMRHRYSEDYKALTRDFYLNF